MFKVNTRNTRIKFEICSNLKIKTPKRRQWCRSGVFIVSFEHISHLVLVFLLVTLSRQMSTGIEGIGCSESPIKLHFLRSHLNFQPENSFIHNLPHLDWSAYTFKKKMLVFWKIFHMY